VRRRALAAVAAAALLACSSGGTKQATAPVNAVVASTTTTATAPALARPLSVTHRDVTFEDTTRPTDADRPTRTLPVLLLVPDGPGPFPLLEFSHGVTASGPAYAGFLEPLAAAGFVVAAPTFPLTSGPQGWSHLTDYKNQPADVYFVVDSVIKMAQDPNDPLFGKVDADKLALAGHSLGAMTTIGAVFNSCCAQTRVRAAIVLSGVEATFDNGSFDARPPVPLLLAHGDNDHTVPYASSSDLFARATGPTVFLSYPGASHTGILQGDDGKLLRDAIVAWLDKWLSGDSKELDALSGDVTSSGIATLQTKNL
jgi:dipeptidyl aminopeptidase/acylaminoacyl peptidase